MESNASTVESTDTATEGQPLTSDKAPQGAENSPKNVSDASNQEKTFTQADINRIVARAEAKAKADALKQIQEEKANAELSELEKERKRAAELEQRASEAESRYTNALVTSALSTAFHSPAVNARDADALIALVNREALELDASGEVKGIDAEIKRLKAKHPALFFQTTADGGSGGGGANANNGVFDFNQEIRRKAGRIAA